MLWLNLALFGATMFFVWVFFQAMNEVRGGVYKSDFFRKWDIYGFLLIVILGVLAATNLINHFVGALFLLFLHPYATMKAAKIDAYLSKGGTLKYSRMTYVVMIILMITFSLVFVNYYTPDNWFIRGIIDIIAVALILSYRVSLGKKYSSYSDFKVKVSTT